MKLKRYLRKLKMRFLLRGMDFKDSLEFWLLSSITEDERKAKHRSDCDEHMLSIHPECRLELLEWKKKKMGYLNAELMKDKTDEMQSRLFQALLEHNQIRALHEAAAMKERMKTVDNPRH